MSRTFKISLTDTAAHEPQVRRFTLPLDGLDMNVLSQQAQKLFKLAGHEEWVFKWTDEDGDKITISENDELRDFLSYYPEPAHILRLDMVIINENAAQPNAVPPNSTQCPPWADLLGDVWTQFDRHQPQPEIRNFGVCYDTEKWRSQRHPHQAPACSTPRHQTEPHRTAATPKCSSKTSADGNDGTLVIGWCDHTGSLLQPGQGWYHKSGTMFDLSEAAFQNLSTEEQSKFVRVAVASDLGTELSAYQRRGIHVGEWNFENFFRNAHTDTTKPHSDSSAFSPFENFRVVWENNGTNSSKDKTALTATVISGPSLVNGTKVFRGSRSAAVWEIRNDGSETWTNVRVKPLSTNNPFQLPVEGFEVPSLGPNTTGLVIVDLAVPPTAELGTTNSTLQMCDQNGDFFGPLLSVDLQVEEQPIPREAELVALLQEMGFHDLAECTRTIRLCNGDVQSAALRLLRSYTADATANLNAATTAIA